jgi:hypothetical protein
MKAHWGLPGCEAGNAPASVSPGIVTDSVGACLEAPEKSRGEQLRPAAAAVAVAYAIVPHSYTRHGSV